MICKLTTRQRIYLYKIKKNIVDASEQAPNNEYLCA